MEIIRFQTNVPQELRLTSLEGRLVDSKFGGSQHLFYAQEGIFYVSEKVGHILMDQFRKLSVKAGDPVEICKSETGSGPGRKTQWIVTVAGFAAHVDNKTVTPEPPSELETKLAASIALVEARKQAQRAPVASNQPEWAQHLVSQTCALVDCYAAVMRHAAQHDNVRGEDVRSIFLSAFINVTKAATAGGRNVA